MKTLTVSGIDLVIFVMIFKEAKDLGLFCARSWAQSRHEDGEGRCRDQFPLIPPRTVGGVRRNIWICMRCGLNTLQL